MLSFLDEDHILCVVKGNSDWAFSGAVDIS